MQTKALLAGCFNPDNLTFNSEVHPQEKDWRVREQDTKEEKQAIIHKLL